MLPADAGEPGDDAFDVLDLREEVIEFEINPDRAYALSLRGVAREAALAFDAPFTDPAARDDAAARRRGLPGGRRRPGRLPGVRRPHGLRASTRPHPRPDWMAAGSVLAGMRPISLAVDVTNYVMLELGRPIHGYDPTGCQGPIRVRRAREGERLTTLDGVDRVLSAEDLVVTDDSGPDRPRRRDGRRDHRDVGDHHPGAGRGRVTGTRSRCSAPAGGTS